ncbi:MAG: hypothetical protein Q9213_003636 [Squamulea squamosa]
MSSNQPASAGQAHQQTHKESDNTAPAVGGAKVSMSFETAQEKNGSVEAPGTKKSPPVSETSQEKPIKPMAEIVAAMFKETKLSEFMKKLFEDHKEWISSDWKNGKFKVLDYACGTGLASQVRIIAHIFFLVYRVDVGAFSNHKCRTALATHVASIIGIDNIKCVVDMYNELVKRQDHPTCAMQAFVGNFVPDAKGSIYARAPREMIEGSDLAIISVEAAFSA